MIKLDCGHNLKIQTKRWVGLYVYSIDPPNEDIVTSELICTMFIECLTLCNVDFSDKNVSLGVLRNVQITQ